MKQLGCLFLDAEEEPVKRGCGEETEGDSVLREKRCRALAIILECVDQNFRRLRERQCDPVGARTHRILIRRHDGIQRLADDRYFHGLI